MWLYAVWCAGGFNACPDLFYTEARPMISTNFSTQQECMEKAIPRAKAFKAEHPNYNIVWKCIDYSTVEVREAK